MLKMQLKHDAGEEDKNVFETWCWKRMLKMYLKYGAGEEC
jgi:hypothetical protein